MPSLCVFCGSNTGRRPEYADAARQLGAEMVRRGIDLVYGGGRVGLMGLLADAVLAAGGEVTGVIPAALAERELAHTGVTHLIVVSSMHQRKATMAERSDGFVALPGGIGTWEEFREMLTWAQLGLHGKPCGLLDVAGYYRPLRQLLENGAAEGFLAPQHLRLFVAAESPAPLLDALDRFEPVDVPKWIDPQSS
jgi:uncharacterized protein (TIGR00730 family)